MRRAGPSYFISFPVITHDNIERISRPGISWCTSRPGRQLVGWGERDVHERATERAAQDEPGSLINNNKNNSKRNTNSSNVNSNNSNIVILMVIVVVITIITVR